MYLEHLSCNKLAEVRGKTGAKSIIAMLAKPRRSLREDPFRKIKSREDSTCEQRGRHDCCEASCWELLSKSAPELDVGFTLQIRKQARREAGPRAEMQVAWLLSEAAQLQPLKKWEADLLGLGLFSDADIALTYNAEGAKALARTANALPAGEIHGLRGERHGHHHRRPSQMFSKTPGDVLQTPLQNPRRIGVIAGNNPTDGTSHNTVPSLPIEISISLPTQSPQNYQKCGLLATLLIGSQHQRYLAPNQGL